MFEKEIEEYERVRKDYQRKVADRMGREQWMEYNEIQFSAHSCAIEGNSFTVDALKTAVERMKSEMAQKRRNSLPLFFF